MALTWKCPKCGREFGKRNQQHSCTVYPLEKHFAGKEAVARPLYNMLRETIEKDIGPVKVESLPCCIHFVVNYEAYTFAAVYALKDRIRIHFGSDRELKSPRIDKSAKVSAGKYMHSIDIRAGAEIDKELVSWLRQAYNLKRKK